MVCNNILKAVSLIAQTPNPAPSTPAPRPASPPSPTQRHASAPTQTGSSIWDLPPAPVAITAPEKTMLYSEALSIALIPAHSEPCQLEFISGIPDLLSHTAFPPLASHPAPIPRPGQTPKTCINIRANSKTCINNSINSKTCINNSTNSKTCINTSTNSKTCINISANSQDLHQNYTLVLHCIHH